MKKQAIACFRVLISIALISILLYIMGDKYGEIFRVLKGTRIPILCLSFIAFLCAITIASLRLMLIMMTQGIHLTFPSVISLTFIGFFFNNFLPTSIGGDVIKAYYISKMGLEKATAFTSVFIDRMLGLFSMIFITFFALLYANKIVIDKRVNYIIYAIAIGAVLILIFITNKNFAKKFSILFYFIRPIEDKVKKIYNGIHMYKYHKALMGQSFLISVLSQLLLFLSFWILLFSIGTRVSIKDIFLRMPIISIVSLLPSLNGLGLREGSTVIFFGPLIGKENAFAVSILGLLILFIVSFIGGMIYVFSPQFKIKIGEIKTNDRYLKQGD